jgi:hypothetical protein
MQPGSRVGAYAHIVLNGKHVSRAHAGTLARVAGMPLHRGATGANFTATCGTPGELIKKASPSIELGGPL